jgi:hypothetical protein
MKKPTRLTRRKALTMAGFSGLAASSMLASASLAQTPKQKRQHPRITRAIEEMQATKEYLESSPNKFGGYKAKAITALEVAIVDLKLALENAGA